MARRRGAPCTRLSLAAHGRAAAARARRLHPDLVFLSPAFPTASHPGAPALGPLRWGRAAARAGAPAAALGGIAPGTAWRLPRRHLAGIAAISPFVTGLSRNRAVA
ncbi:MAG TPA: thiamine phosphate synthase [Roseomonas sp.]